MNKNIFYALSLVALLVGISCKEVENTHPNTITYYDHEAQLPKDRDSLIKYLSTHYYNPGDENIYTIGDEEGLPNAEQLPLFEDPKLKTIEGIEANGTVATYSMYYYMIHEGEDNINKGFASPSPIDSVRVKYRGQLPDGTVFDDGISDENGTNEEPIWLQLIYTIEGWRRGLPKFKRGLYTKGANNEDNYSGNGKGYIFFPSGLGYGEIGSYNIPANSNLIFKVELFDVNLIDTDLDGVPTKFEINIDNAGNITTYDTDGDGFEDYRDVTDDKDKVSTRDEVYYEYVFIKDDQGNSTEEYDSRGNIKFLYSADGKRIIGKENEVPNYKNPNIVPPGFEE